MKGESRKAKVEKGPLLPVPGCGLPPDAEGLYWVLEPTAGRMIAVCQGKAPFLRVRLLDPWGDGKHPLYDATQKVIEVLVWEGKIAVPEERADATRNPSADSGQAPERRTSNVEGGGA